VHFTNRDPVAKDDQYTIPTDTLLQVSVANGILANDTDADGNTLQPIILNQPQHGSLHIVADGGFTYQPDSGYAGPDFFTYKANDGKADSDKAATVSITVHAVNHAPILTPSNHIVTPDTVLQVGVPSGVLANAKDPDKNLIHVVVITGPANGKLHMKTNGSFTYTPKPGYTGPDKFVVTGTDNHTPKPGYTGPDKFVVTGTDNRSPSALTTIVLNVTHNPNPLSPAKPIPTLSQWAVILLSMLMFIVAGRFRRMA